MGEKINEQWVTKNPIWEIFTPFIIYKLLTNQEVEVSNEVVTDNFTKLT